MIWTDAMIERIRELAGQGLSAQGIADGLNDVFNSDATRNSVIGIMSRRGIALGKSGKFSHDAWSEGDEQRLRALAAGGYSAAKIAEALGNWSTAAVNAKAKRMGIAIHRVQPRSHGKASTSARFDKSDLTLGIRIRNARNRAKAPRIATPKPISPSIDADPVSIDPISSSPRALLDLESWQCHFPVGGSGASTLYCAAPAELARLSHSAYCGRHHAAMYSAEPRGLKSCLILPAMTTRFAMAVLS